MSICSLVQSHSLTIVPDLKAFHLANERFFLWTAGHIGRSEQSHGIVSSHSMDLGQTNRTDRSTLYTSSAFLPTGLTASVCWTDSLNDAASW